MDPFEVRMRFTSLLSHLSASHTSHTKAAVFALKNREMDEDLHSCILEQLERNSMNNRANIMYFIETMCEMARKEGVLEFVRMMQRDIMRVVDAVVPVDGTGAANVRVVRKVCCHVMESDVDANG
jgi:CTD kinase subunit gamma